jgi:hypothetical protein
MPSDIKTWIVESTVSDVKSVLAGHLYDGADLDESDVRDIRRTVVCDSIILGLTGSHVLFPMAASARVRKETKISEYFLGVMERSLNWKFAPICNIPNSVRTAARLAEQLDQLVAKRMGLTWLYVSALNSVNPPNLPQIPNPPT